MRGSSSCNVEGHNGCYSTRWQLPGQLQHLLLGGRALELRPAAVFVARHNRGTRLIADIRTVSQRSQALLAPPGNTSLRQGVPRCSRGLCSRETGSSPGQQQGCVVSLSRCCVKAQGAQTKRYSTRYSRVVTQRSTDLAQSSLPSVIGRERGCSGWYDRSMVPLYFW